jgi:glutamine amidotransferase
MCIVISKPRGRAVKRDVYETCFDNNKDGAGFIVREKTGELRMEKGFFTFKEFWEHFQPHQSKQAIIHFRIKTHGKLDLDNCHPFWVKENSLAFAHNGIISAVDTSSDETMSDTWHFNEAILQHLQDKMGEEFIFDPIIQELISGYIGINKLAFIHQDGRTLIFNKSLGTMEDGVWFSNYSYRDWNNNKKKSKGKFWNQANIQGAANQNPFNGQYSGYVPPPPAPPSIPLPAMRAGPPLSSTIRTNDYIEMLSPFRDLKGNEVGVVISIYGDRTAEIKIFDKNYPTGWKIRNIPFEHFKCYTPVESQRDFEQESKLLFLTDANKVRTPETIEGQVLSRETPSYQPIDMSKVTKIGQTLEESACNDVCGAYRENYLH